MMTDIIEHRESQLNLLGSVKRSLLTGFDDTLVFCSDQTLPEVGTDFMRKCPALHAECRCEFGVLSLGGGDLWILQREVFYILTCVHSVGRLEKHVAEHKNEG